MKEITVLKCARYVEEIFWSFPTKNSKLLGDENGEINAIFTWGIAINRVGHKCCLGVVKIAT